ncbi:hypothetical protein [Streptococcus macacae]|uniref:Uncharacterized protein n=1 Tax=Streptococcus macacae NCTC 11558 TaxID=764298 RepID=G5JWM4_9STRE|nr:hypothetical protein [Streptococcus macacae]EHJ52381.1 hypothetical protein STRMA_0996 [Streptococcus macacae NCTC 11558]SUN78815.1 Uncharacterised protein [Streptococcus macacae NCTC 11558]
MADYKIYQYHKASLNIFSSPFTFNKEQMAYLDKTKTPIQQNRGFQEIYEKEKFFILVTYD